MNNSSKFVWPCRAETPAEKRIREEWLAQQKSVVELTPATQPFLEQSEHNQ